MYCSVLRLLQTESSSGAFDDLIDFSSDSEEKVQPPCLAEDKETSAFVQSISAVRWEDFLADSFSMPPEQLEHHTADHYRSGLATQPLQPIVSESQLHPLANADDASLCTAALHSPPPRPPPDFSKTLSPPHSASLIYPPPPAGSLLPPARDSSAPSSPVLTASASFPPAPSSDFHVVFSSPSPASSPRLTNRPTAHDPESQDDLQRHASPPLPPAPPPFLSGELNISQPATSPPHTHIMPAGAPTPSPTAGEPAECDDISLVMNPPRDGAPNMVFYSATESSSIPPLPPSSSAANEALCCIPLQTFYTTHAQPSPTPLEEQEFSDAAMTQPSEATADTRHGLSSATRSTVSPTVSPAPPLVQPYCDPFDDLCSNFLGGPLKPIEHCPSAPPPSNPVATRPHLPDAFESPFFSMTDLSSSLPHDSPDSSYATADRLSAPLPAAAPKIGSSGPFPATTLGPNTSAPIAPAIPPTDVASTTGAAGHGESVIEQQQCSNSHVSRAVGDQCYGDAVGRRDDPQVPSTLSHNSLCDHSPDEGPSTASTAAHSIPATARCNSTLTTASGEHTAQTPSLAMGSVSGAVVEGRPAAASSSSAPVFAAPPFPGIS
eukprot:GHVQ01031740.1.p1 GENE.GHVQ01031740.1~~GHVQ01031740.1.p1  ORF type:complete len:606 (-),score=127.06 GHVQ01031740.1:226-2043(-)